MKKKLLIIASTIVAVFFLSGLAAEAAEAEGHPTVTVEPGDTLWSISGSELDDPYRWREVAVYNEIPDPDVISVGAVIDIPTAPVELPPLPVPEPTPAPKVKVQAETKAKAHVHEAPARRTTVTTTHTHAAPAAQSSTSSHLNSIAQCESGGNYGAVSSSGKYRGAYQFDQQTWQSVGGSGDPAAASPSEQDARAQALYNERGGQPWPVCSRR